MNLTLLAQDARSTTVGWQPVPGAACYALEWSDRMSDTVRFRTAGQTRDCRFRFVRSTHIPYYLRLRALDEAGSTLELSPVLTTPLARVLYPQLEALDRGLVAVATSAGVFLSWRLLRSEVDGDTAQGMNHIGLGNLLAYSQFQNSFIQILLSHNEFCQCIGISDYQEMSSRREARQHLCT